MQIFNGNWGAQADVERDFEIDPLPASVNILFAHYNLDGYEGFAFVLYEQDGKLFWWPPTTAPATGWRTNGNPKKPRKRR